MGYWGFAFAGGLALSALGKSLVDNVFYDQVKVVPGSVVYCDLYAFEHSGIVIGENQIVHLNGDGMVEQVSFREFLNRLEGFNNALSIYASSYKNHNGDVYAVGSTQIAKRASRLVGTRLDYQLLSQNCHNFSMRCLVGDDSQDAWTFSELKRCAEAILGANTWRVVDRD